MTVTSVIALVLIAIGATLNQLSKDKEKGDK